VFLNLIDDADIVTGWNSESYDIPYIHNRIVQVMGREHTRRLCLWNRLPRKREYQSFGRDAVTYDLAGRVHLDYLQLYRKHTYHEMHSYRLDFVGEYEVGEKKIAYEGSLDSLYNNDFERFIEYSRQDVMLLVKIDAKLKFIDLSSDLAHTNGVLLATTMGSVLLLDNAITNEAHDLGLMVPSRVRSHAPAQDELGDDGLEPHGIVGAYVADPVQGMHSWIGGVDINSLYPSAIRALNMSKETVVGQIRPSYTDQLIHKRVTQEKKTFADAWNDTFGTLEYNMMLNRDLTMLTVDFEDGTTVELTSAEMHDWIFHNQKRKLAVSANGTIFSMEKEGIVPGLLARWYSERKILQKNMRSIDKIKKGIEIPEDLLSSVKKLLP
jgi:DNA polymerase elongation subunit (family B)